MGIALRDIRIPAAGGGENRATSRRDVRLQARVRERGSQRFTIRVVDLSATGLRGETAFGLRPGTVIWITLAGLEGLEASVVWQAGALVGVAFRRPLHPAVLEHIVEGGR